MNRDQFCNSDEEIVETDRLIMRRLRPDDYLAIQHEPERLFTNQ